MKTLLQKSISICFLLLCIGLGQSVFAQTPTSGDYRSRVTGNWNTAATWQVRTGTTWATASAPPTSTSNVYVQNGHTVTVDVTVASCNDLDANTSGVLAIGTNALQVNGKTRAYTGTAVTTAGADGTFYSGQASTSTLNGTFITSSGGGKLSYVGNTRTFTTTAEWGATSTGFDCEVALSSGQTGTFASNVKAASWTMTSGIVDLGAQTMSADDGTNGGNITIASGATLLSAGSSNNIFQRSGNNPGATLTVNGTLTLTGAAPKFQMTTYAFSAGTIQYTLAGSQTFASRGNGTTPGNYPLAYGNVTCSGSGTKTTLASQTTTVSGTIQTSVTVAIGAGGGLTINGTAQINPGAFFANSPTYGAASTLIYNSSYGTSNEWNGGATASVVAGAGVPANVQVLTGTVTLAGGRGVPGNVTVSSGAGMVLNSGSGDLYIGGNLTNNGSSWINNSRAVVFVKTGTSVISAGAGTQFLDYFLINKTSGSVQLATGTNVTLNTTAGSVLQILNAGTLDLNGQTLTLNNSGGNILVDGTAGGTAKSITSSTGTGTIAITNVKTASGTAGGTLSTSSAVAWVLTGGMNFGGVTTVNGTLQINSGGFVTTNAPVYGTGSLLKYNSGTNPYTRGVEWGATSGAGYPYNVQVSNNTNVDPAGTTRAAVALNLANDLTIDSGSGFYMDYSGHNMTVPLTINGSLLLSGGLSASGASGGDIIVKGNWTRTGTFAPNSRAVFFQGPNAQTLTGQTTFDYILIDKTGGSFTLIDNMIVNQTLTFTSTNTSNITTGSNNVVISASGSVNRLAGYVYGHLQKFIGTGTSTRTFEVGDATVYAPVTLAYTGVSTGGNITVTTIVNDHPQAASSGIDTSKSVNRYYSIANVGLVGGTYDATFTFVSGDVDGGANTANFVVRRYVNPTWFTTTTGTRTSTSTQATGLSAYGDFQIGEGAALTVATNPSGNTVCGGDATSFTSTSSSSPSPTVQWQRGISGVYTNIDGSLDGGVYSNFNTTTLNVSDVSGLNGYTYRAVFTNINGTATSTAATLTSGITTTYNGSWSPSAPTSLDKAIISSSFTASSNITACSLVVNNSAVVDIPATYNVTLNGSLTVSSGSFTLENNSNLVQQNYNGANSGAIIVRRNSASIMRQDYTLWSSPVAGQNLLAFSPNTLVNRFYTYNPSTDFYTAVASPSTTNFATGVGYLIRVSNLHPTTPTVWNGEFNGVPNNGNVSLSVSSGTYNAVGNPYPSTISADSFITANSLTAPLYFWRKANNTAQPTSPTTSYATYTLAGGAGTGSNSGDPLGLIPNGTIQVGQGFIARATSSSLNFNNAMRTADNNNQFLRTTVDNRNRFWLDMKNAEGFASQMMVAYMPGATTGVDAAIDGLFFNDVQTALTSVIEGQEYTIQGRGLPFDTADVVPLGMKSEAAGAFTISINKVDGFFDTESTTIYLKDNLLGATHNLSDSAYGFVTEPGVYNNRFEVVFENQLAVDQPTFNSNQVVVYKQNQNIVINTGTVKMSKVQLYDVRGRLLIEQTNINASEIKLNAGLTHEMLIVKITSHTDAVVTKKIVN